MQRYAITIAYDGTDYCGWQVQPHVLTVAQKLETVFAETFGFVIKLLAASRTDAGVHAYGQIAIFDSPTEINTKKFLVGWNNALPGNILIRSIKSVDSSFYPRHHVDYKIYQYHFFIDRPLPFVARYGIHLKHPINLEKLNSALQQFVGTHDFRSFCSNKDEKATIKKIDMVTLTHIKRYNMFRITVRGESFLHHMIRRMVGAAIHIASYRKLSPEIIKQQLENPVTPTLPNAPALGLMLRKIKYKYGL